MEISDGQPPQDRQEEKPLPPPADLTERVFKREVRKTFRAALKLIRVALLTHYQIEEDQAPELEKALFLWFRRFCMRPANHSVADSVPFLLLACCDFAQKYKKFLLESQAIAANKKLRCVLAREPKKVARAMARKLKLRRRFPDV